MTQKKTSPEGSDGKRPLSASFVTGAIALIFLVTGYQTALFVHKAAVSSVAAHMDRPDTVYIYVGAKGGEAEPFRSICRDPVAKRRADKALPPPKIAPAGRSAEMREAVRKVYPRKVESFRFDPNTASLDELERLGFSPKQAESILRYREKGGRFRRKEDFAKSYVVADSVYQRLEPYIDIPKIDLNRADSAAFTSLPGVGKWFAAKMVEHRRALHGYSYPEQLMDIYNFDREKYEGLRDLIRVSPPEPYPLWTLPSDSLRKHPYIRTFGAARAIVLFRENSPKEEWTVGMLKQNGILPEEDAEKLSRCLIECPQ